jgi:hypothetical protein
MGGIDAEGGNANRETSMTRRSQRPVAAMQQQSATKDKTHGCSFTNFDAKFHRGYRREFQSIRAQFVRAPPSFGREHIGSGLVARVANKCVTLHPRNDRMRRDDDINHFGAALGAQSGPRLGACFGHGTQMPVQG